MSDRTLAPGQSFNFRAAVVNDVQQPVENPGDADADATTLCYYRFDGQPPPFTPAIPPTMPLTGDCPPTTDPLSSYGTLVGTDEVQEINWSSAFTEEDLTSREDIQLDAPMLPAMPMPADHDYYYYACVLPVENEVDVDNNCSATALDEAVRVLVGDEPDLVVEGPSVDDTVLGLGQPFNLRVGVVNRGNGDSPATTLRYYLSVDDSLERDADTTLETDAVGALDAAGWPPPPPDEVDPAAQSREDIDLTAPSTAGVYHYFACVDAVADEVDAVMNNNCASIQITVAGGPNLVVESPRVSEADLLLGQPFTFSATVVNLGDGGSTATTLRYYRSTSATISPEDVQEGTDDVGVLEPGNEVPRNQDAESREDIELTAPESSGTYYYYACVDSVSAELATDDNCTMAVEVTVRGAPDLRVLSPSASPDVLGLGEAFTLSVTVRNAGDVVARATDLHYYLSEDAVISTTGDLQVGTDEVGPLNPSEESSEEIELTAPGSRGTYYYGACVVAVRTETAIDNNCSAGVPVEVTAEPNLVVADIAIAVSEADRWPETHNPGQSFNLSVAVRNVGRDHSAATELHYYRSSDEVINPDTDEKVGTDPVRAIRYSVSFNRDDLTSSEDIQLVAPTTGGFYWYYACVDSVLGEMAKDDNCSGVFVVLVGNAPDLAAEGPAVIDSVGVGTPPRENDDIEETVLGPGQTFRFRVGAVNRGDGDSPATTLRYYRSRDRTITTADTPVGTDDIGPLRASFPPSEFPDQVHGDSQSRQEIELTAPTEEGIYFYGACITRVPREADPSDDCSEEVRVEVRGTPDLDVSTVTVDENRLPPEGTFTLTATVVNYGNGGSVATTLRYYLSTDSTISREDQQVGTANVPQLNVIDTTPGNPSAQATLEIELTAPGGAGVYYYGACVDPPPHESRTRNNCSRGVRVEVTTAAPDLVVRPPSVSDITLNTGQSFDFGVAVVNRGRGNAAATTLRYYRSADAIIDRTDMEVGTDPVRELRYSQAFMEEDRTSQEDIRLAAPAVEAIYHYYACVDPLANEINTGNNCSEVVRILVGNDPNLAVEGPSVSDSAETVLGPGQTFQFRVGVVNRGDGDSPATTLRYYRSSDRAISSADTPVGAEGVVPGLRASFPPSAWPQAVHPDSLSRQEVELTAPTTAGVHYYGACVVAVPREADTGDNCSTAVRVEVRGTPDLMVEAPAVDEDRLLPGTSLTLTATVVNYGSGGSVDTTLRYYLSTDSTISGEDQQVGTAEVGQLAVIDATPRNPDAQATLEIELTAPGGVGVYYYGACVDPPPHESRTSNNCSRGVRVEVTAAPPDLVVEQPSVSDITLNTGQSFNLRTAVFNQGFGNAEETTLRYYRSADIFIDPATDEEVGTDPVREIRYSQAFTEEDRTSREDIQLAAPTVEGIYRYYACVDPVPGETAAGNNCSDPIRVLVGDDPNLTAEGPSASANVLGPGQSFNFRVGVLNRGDGDSPATDLRYYRSSDQTISAADAQVGTGEVPELRASFPPSAWPQEVADDSLERLETELIAPTDEGIYYYGACVAAVSGEADTSDNCSTGVRVEVRGAPDLVVEAPSVDDERLLRGQPFTLTATVANLGRGGSAATELRCYRSEDGEISRTDIQVGTDDVAQLEPIHEESRNPAAETQAECALTAPNQLGAHYYYACVEAPPRESRTDNNCSQTVRVLVSSGPDLVVEGLRLEGAEDDGKLFFGQSFRLGASVVNEGDLGFAESTLRFYRSDDAEVTAGDVEVGAVQVTPTAVVGLEIPLEASSVGVQYYGACVDAVPNETDAGNNCASASVRVRVVLGPDLVIEAARVDDDSLAPGQTFIFQASVVNDGDSGSARTTVRYYRSVDDRISARDAQIGTDPVPSLNIVDRGIPWSASRSRQGHQLKAPTAEGSYYYGACVDSGGNESNANNNCSAAVRVEVSRRNRAGDPDLAVDASVSRSYVMPGDAFTLWVQVRNHGDEASENTQLRYYRSTNAVVSGDADDVALGADVVEGIPKSNGDEVSRSLHSLEVTAPDASGVYYYGACVDPVAGEPEVADNCADGARITVREDRDEDGGEGAGENMDEAAEAPPSLWRGWRSILLRPPPEPAHERSSPPR